MKSRSCSYQFIGRTADAAFIVDRCLPGKRSLTNDAEAVCIEMHRCWGCRRIIYRDSDGRWDELLHDKGTFSGYAALSGEDRRRFAEFLIGIEEIYPPLQDGA